MFPSGPGREAVSEVIPIGIVHEVGGGGKRNDESGEQQKRPDESQDGGARRKRDGHV